MTLQTSVSDFRMLAARGTPSERMNISYPSQEKDICSVDKRTQMLKLL